jgi:PhzF family phenazine biosynthesis protein
MIRVFKQVDVFTAVPYRGNPVAVVLDGAGLTPAEMQAFTDWTNLSEATFILPPTDSTADYKLRIFCLGRELPFAGHPTLGSCHAWLEAGGKPKGEFIVQECGVGLVKIRRDGNRLAFMAPPRQKSGPLPEEDVALIARGLGVAREEILQHAWCNNGPNWRAVMLKSAMQVLALKPDAAVLKGLDIGVVGPHPAGSETKFEIRAFFTVPSGIAEDPVTAHRGGPRARKLCGEPGNGTRPCGAGSRAKGWKRHLDRGRLGQLY